MAQVLDYSGGFPGAAAIKRAGYVGAVRYIGFPDRRKCTTRAELADFDREGIGMALVFEATAGNWRGGAVWGKTDGRIARDHANAIEFPADRPIYMAIDQDVVSSGEFATMIEYLRGAGRSLGGPDATGVYGEADVINRARDAGVAAWFWQTAAWSRGVHAEGCHLYQRVGTVTVGEVGCDVNDILARDWGQHNARGSTVSKQDALDALSDFFNGNLDSRNIGAAGPRSLLQAFQEANLRSIKSNDTLNTVVGKLDGIVARLDELVAQPSSPGSGATIEEVRAAIAEIRLAIEPRG
jgi:hypothetical protein